MDQKKFQILEFGMGKRGDGLRVAGCRKLGTGRVGGAPSTRRRRVDDWDAVSELPANFFLSTGRVENFYFSIHFRFFSRLFLRKGPIQFKEKA